METDERDRQPVVTHRGLRRFAHWARSVVRRGARGDSAPAAPAFQSEFERVKASWDALGRHDPLWAIVSTPDKRGNAWDRDEFFATGVVEARHLMNKLRDLDLQFARDHALDFGAGVGRLTQALAAYFRHVDGVDISPSMIEQANAFNRYPDRVRYFLGTGERLSFDDASYDFVFSTIVLQHVGIELQRSYVREFLRVLKPGGLAVFQAPSRALKDQGMHFRSLVETPDGTVTIDMNVFPRAEVERTIHDAGGKLLNALADANAGDAFESLLYIATR